MKKLKKTDLENLAEGQQLFNENGDYIGSFTGFETPLGLELNRYGKFIDVPIYNLFVKDDLTPTP